MKTISTRAYIALIAALATATLPDTRADANDFSNTSELATYYLQQRALIAPIIPPLLPSSIDTIEAMILKSDFSFQDWDDWYFGWSDGPHVAEGELAAYDGHLVDVLQTNHFVSTDASGIVLSPGLSAPSRHYRVYVRQEDLQ